MKFDLTRPCAACPFRTDIDFYLSPGRVHAIYRDITDGDASFSCHKTTEFDDGEYRRRPDEQHCAGAMVMLMRMDMPNQIMRIAMRIGMFDPDALDMDAPVFHDVDAMALAREHAYGIGRPRRRQTDGPA